jgi:hypothetical protein
MCDYSLHGLPTRLAVVGERLLTYRFRTGSIGLASPLDLAAPSRPKDSRCSGWWATLKLWLVSEMELDRVPAVCIPPGSRLRMSQVPDRAQKSYSLRQVEEVTFVQLTADAFRYRDAIRFDNGRQKLLQTLAEGILFQVLWLDVEERAPETVNLVPERAA